MENLLFYDEEGNPIEFTIQAKFGVGDSEYMALETPGDDQIYLLRVVEDPSGDFYLEGIEDDELDIVSDAYEELITENKA